MQNYVLLCILIKWLRILGTHCMLISSQPCISVALSMVFNYRWFLSIMPSTLAFHISFFKNNNIFFSLINCFFPRFLLLLKYLALVQLKINILSLTLVLSIYMTDEPLKIYFFTFETIIQWAWFTLKKTACAGKLMQAK